jgi:hypothetical protein
MPPTVTATLDRVLYHCLAEIRDVGRDTDAGRIAALSIPTVPLGFQGLQVSKQGLGCMGMSAFYGSDDEKESVATLERALELGVTFWDSCRCCGSSASRTTSWPGWSR